jgi:hypothetical protein
LVVNIDGTIAGEYGSVILIGTELGADETEGEVLGAEAAGLLTAVGTEGPLVQAVVAAIKEAVAATVSRRALMENTVTLSMVSCLPALFSLHSGDLC